MWLSDRPGTDRRPHGYPNAPAYAALVNGVLLLPDVGFVAVEAVRRLVTRAGHVNGLSVLLVSGLAAVVMVAGPSLLRGDSDEDDDSDADRANMRSMLLDTVADAAGAAGVAAAGRSFSSSVDGSGLTQRSPSRLPW